jgi:hypothetical protein
MKLYTEEEVIELMYWISPVYMDREDIKIFLENKTTPIEIPSDNIIKEAANGNIDGYNGAMWLKYNYIIKKKS